MRCIKLPQFQNVGPNQRVSLPLPLGVVYEKFYLMLGGNILTSLMTNIVLKLNNKELQRWDSAADFNALAGYKGNYVGTQYMIMDFTERLAREEVGMKLGTIAACQEAGVQSFSLEFDLGNYVNSAASTIAGWTDVDLPSANKIVPRVQKIQKVIAAAAEEQIIVPFGQNGFQLKRMIIKHTNLDSVHVVRDGVEQFQSLPVALANVRESDFGRTPQGGYHIVDFQPDSLQSNALNTAFLRNSDGSVAPIANLDIRVKTTAADVLTIYTEAYALNSQL